MTKDEVLARLRALTRLERPVWLAGGVGVDFHVGRWTRDHGDIDLVTFEEHREGLDEELTGLGFTQTDDRGWITNWTNDGTDPGEVAIAYERRLDEDTGALVMLPSFDGVEPGIYPGFPGNLRLDRFGVLEDVRFRVCSAEDEWAYATAFATIRPGARERDSVRHNLELLETVIGDLDAVRAHPAFGSRSTDAATVTAMAELVPPDFDVPLGFENPDFVLEPLGPEHNDSDYDAWTSSMEHIGATPGFPWGSWPHEMSLDENRADLEQHADDFRLRKGFTYTVLDPASRMVIGCLYVYPTRETEYDAQARSWVRASHEQLDAPLWRAVSDWLAADWPFENVHYAPR